MDRWTTGLEGQVRDLVQTTKKQMLMEIDSMLQHPAVTWLSTDSHTLDNNCHSLKEVLPHA